MNLFRLAHGSKRQEWACESQTNSESRGRGEFEARGPLRLAPLTGRDTELSLLKDRWEQAQEGVLHIPAERVNSDHTTKAALVPIRISANFLKDLVHIDGPLAVYGTRSVRLECLYLTTSKDDETLTWILHVTGKDRLGTTAIYLKLTDMHVTQKW